jgi:hypothetical protein
LAAASSGVSFGSKETVTTSKSRLGRNGIASIALVRPFSDSVQSIGHS